MAVESRGRENKAKRIEGLIGCHLGVLAAAPTSRHHGARRTCWRQARSGASSGTTLVRTSGCPDSYDMVLPQPISIRRSAREAVLGGRRCPAERLLAAEAAMV